MTTGLRMAAYLIYRANAYRVFPALSRPPVAFPPGPPARGDRLQRLRGGHRLVEQAQLLDRRADHRRAPEHQRRSRCGRCRSGSPNSLQRLTNQLNGVLFPAVVDSDASERPDRLRTIFIQGTRLSLFGVVPIAAALFMLAGPLIHAWVGPNFAASVPVTQILVVVIAIRVGNATATTILKGAGQHRMLAFTNASAALSNVALSLLWIRTYGLIGQAFGTLVPVAGSAIFVLWPAACRRVGLGLGTAFRLAVWPAVWPIVVMAAIVLPLRHVLPVHIASVGLAAVAGGLVTPSHSSYSPCGATNGRPISRKWDSWPGCAAGFRRSLRETRVRGIILAAGKGSRLNGTAGDRPKCLLRVGDMTLIERQIESLRAAGIDDIAVVVGCAGRAGASAVRPRRALRRERALRPDQQPVFAVAGTRRCSRDGFVVMNCDVLLHPQMLDDLLSARVTRMRCCSPISDETACRYGDEEMKVRSGAAASSTSRRRCRQTRRTARTSAWSSSAPTGRAC